MHKVAIEHLKPGLQLGKSLYNERGDVLLARGAALSERYIAAIVNRGFHSVLVMDGVADDLEPLQLITDHLHASISANVKGLFDLMEHATKPVRDQAAQKGAHMLAEVPLQMDNKMVKSLSALYKEVESLLDEVMTADTLAGMVSLKSHDHYTFQHSVDVAVYGVMLGQRLALKRAELRELALGCLLHDIGKQYVDERILNKPGRLTDDEFGEIMEHSLLGYQLVKQMPLESPRPSHIVLQHHERQDSSGYPNKLFGSNRIVRSSAERYDSRRINFMAEIAAVSDVYSAVSSDRPYRPALPPQAVLAVLRESAGGHLNGEMVNTFLSFLQVYPLGMPVQVISGRHRGSLGVVAKCHSQATDRPMVRLMFDPSGKRIADIEVDLRHVTEPMELAALPELEISLEEYANRLQMRRAA